MNKTLKSSKNLIPKSDTTVAFQFLVLAFIFCLIMLILILLYTVYSQGSIIFRIGSKVVVTPPFDSPQMRLGLFFNFS